MDTLPNFEAAEIRKRIPMSVAIQLMKEAFHQLSIGSAQVPVRTAIEAEGGKGVALFMPSYSSQWKIFGLKMVSVFPENLSPKPIIQGKMLLMDATDGRPLAILDAVSLTALRTGAASGLASDLLAPHDASTLAIFGTGAQAITQVEGVCEVRPIKKIFVKGTSREKEEQFCRLIEQRMGKSASKLSSPMELKSADIICTATTSLEPLFGVDDVKEGAHINGIGSFKAHMREIPAEVIKKSRLVVDQRAAALSEAGDLAIPIKDGLISATHIHAELGEIIAGIRSGRVSEKEITVFKSVGNAIQDLALAQYLLANYN